MVVVGGGGGGRGVVERGMWWRRRRCERGKVKEEIVATALILSAKLWRDISRLWIVDTRSARIRIWINSIRALVKCRSCGVRSRIGQRGFHTEYRLRPGPEKGARTPARASTPTWKAAAA